MPEGAQKVEEGERWGLTAKHQPAAWARIWLIVDWNRVHLVLAKRAEKPLDWDRVKKNRSHRGNSLTLAGTFTLGSAMGMIRKPFGSQALPRTAGSGARSQDFMLEALMLLGPEIQTRTLLA